MKSAFNLTRRQIEVLEQANTILAIAVYTNGNVQEKNHLRRTQQAIQETISLYHQIQEVA